MADTLQNPALCACGHIHATVFQEGVCSVFHRCRVVGCDCREFAPAPAAPAPEATREAEDTLIRLLAVWVNYKQGSHLDVTLPQNVSRALLAMLQDGDVRLVRESERAAQAREIETLRADAERWRFVRPRLCIWRERTMAGERHPFLRVEIGRGRMPDDTPTCSGDAKPDVLDAAIDAALAARAATTEGGTTSDG